MLEFLPILGSWGHSRYTGRRLVLKLPNRGRNVILLKVSNVFRTTWVFLCGFEKCDGAANSDINGES